MIQFLLTFVLCVFGFAAAIPDEPGSKSIMAGFIVAIAIAVNRRD